MLISQVQQILFGVWCRSKQVQQTLFCTRIRIHLNRKDSILITYQFLFTGVTGVRFNKYSMVSGVGLNMFSEYCLVTGQVMFEQVGQYIDNLQDRKIGSANSNLGQVQVYIGSSNAVGCPVRLGLNRQDSILISYKIESQVQQIVFGVRFRSKQVQRTIFGARLGQA